MNCPVCGTPLGDSQARCSGCGYSFSEPLDLQADVAPPGARPKEVVLAVKLLALNLGLNAVLVILVFARVVMAGEIALHVLFIALIWWGVRWARILFLFVVGCRVLLMIWGLMAAAAMNHVSGYLGGVYGSLSIDLAIDFFVAYLLLQRESRNWFYGRSGVLNDFGETHPSLN